MGLLAHGRIAQGLDDIAQLSQRLVNATGFPQTHALGLGVFLPLRAREVNEIEPRLLDNARAPSRNFLSRQCGNSE